VEVVEGVGNRVQTQRTVLATVRRRRMSHREQTRKELG
jgi:hypothetical protein